MESQETNNPHPEDTTSDINQPPQGENTNGVETLEAKLENSTDVTGEKDSESSTTISQQNENSTSENSLDAQVDENSDQEVITPDASKTYEKVEDIENLSSDLKKNGDSSDDTLESVDNKNEQLLAKIDEKRVGILNMGSIFQPNINIRNGLVRLHNSLVSSYEQSRNYELISLIEDAKKAIELIDSLEKYKEELNQKNELLISEKRQLEKNCHDWNKECNILDEEIRKLTAERNSFYPKLKSSESEIQYLKKELDKKIDNYHQQIDQKNDQIANLKQEKQDLEEKLETNRTKLVSTLASVNRNTGTHYDGTSDRPQHHVLTGEYKTLKEQYLDPLANSLFTLMATSNPELKQQRREKVNDIKADISAIVLIGGQAMMRGESTSSIELPSGMLNEMLNLFNRELGIFDPNQSPQVSELLTKAANLAQGKGQYSVPGKWEEDDFKQAIRELTEKLCQKLQLNSTTLNSDIQTEIQKAINNALVFIERTNLAEPAALLSLDKEGMTFNCDFYEAAKGYEDEGKVTKVIYPAYIVDLKAKVKAIVLTEPSTIIPQSNPDPAPSSTGEILSSTGSPSNSPVSATQSPEITENEKEKIRLEAKLEAKLESLINAVKYRLIEHSSNPNSSENCLLLATLNQITSLEIIQQIETELYQPYPNLMTFTQRVNELIN